MTAKKHITLSQAPIDGARALMSNGEYVMAAEKLFELVKLHPLDATAFALLSITLDYQGASKQAEQMWKTAMQLDTAEELGEPDSFIKRLFSTPPPLSEAKIFESAENFISQQAFSSAKEMLQRISPELRENKWLELMSTVLIQREEIAELTNLTNSFPPAKALMSLRNENRDNLQQRAIEQKIPPIIIFALPKSASHYINTKLQTILRAPQATVGRGFGNRIGDYVVPGWAKNTARGGCVVTNHLSAKAYNFQNLAKEGLTKIIVHVRDPRQALISWVHHLDNELDKRTEREKNIFHDPDYNPGWSLEKKIDYHLPGWMRFAAEWLEDWQKVAISPDDGMDVLFTTYEDFVLDERQYFKQIFHFYDLPLEYLKDLKIEKPKPGELHFRTGKINEWRNILTSAQQETATSMIPASIKERLGY